MTKERASKNLKLKILDVSMSAIVEEPVNISYDRELEIKNLHYHLIYELFYVGDVPLTLYDDEGAQTFSRCLVCIPPFYKHRTVIRTGQRMVFSFDKTARGTSEFSHFMDKFFSTPRPFKIELNDTLLFLCRELGEA